MLLGDFLRIVESVEVSKRDMGTNMSFDTRFYRLVEKIKSVVCKEYGIPVEKFEELSKETELFISLRIIKLYREFNQLLEKSIKNLGKLVAY